MTEAFILTVLFVWGFDDPAALRFTEDGIVPAYRVGHFTYPGGEPLTVFTALRWPA